MSKAVDAVAVVEAGTIRLSQLITAELAQSSDEQVIEWLALARQRAADIASIASYIEAEAVTRLRYGKQQVGPWQVDVRGGSTKRANYQDRDVAWALLADVYFDEVTGEIVEEARQIVDKTITALLEAAAPRWRSTKLEERGLNPDDYSERVPSRRTIQLTPVVEPEPVPAAIDGAVA